LKLFFLSAHYSHPIDYTAQKIQEAGQALERIRILLNKIGKKDTRQAARNTRRRFKEIEEVRGKFIEAMDEDFNMPQALAAVFELVNLANKKIEDKDFAQGARRAIKELLDILGISLKAAKLAGLTDEEIRGKVLERQKARRDKNYALSDAIRRELEERGVILEDTKEGTTWRRKL
jgi:cysteinyl-tRNA synthetase